MAFIIRIGFNPWLRQPTLGITCFLLCFAWVLSSFFFGVLGRARAAIATCASLLSTPGLPLPHEFSLRSLSALTYRQIQDLGAVGSIFLGCSEPGEGLWLFSVSKTCSPAVSGDESYASFYQTACMWCHENMVICSIDPQSINLTGVTAQPWVRSWRVRLRSCSQVM